VKGIKLKPGRRLPPLSGEESMDVQWSSGIARDAKVRVYAAGSLFFTDLDPALDAIVADAASDPTLKQVSISLGLGEETLSPSGALSGEVKIQNDNYLRLAALGVNVFVSSGDDGAITGGQLQPEFAASSPWVIGVGGTELHLGTGGAVASEPGWAGSGGGLSKVFDRPSYQSKVGPPDNKKRMVPDVSLVAAPETGAYVRVNGRDQVIGGTSLSAPVWAGFCALLNESRAKAKKPPLPFLNPLLYRLNGTDCFRDIKGNNNGEYEAVAGYDLVTGLGVPNLKKLSAKLNE